MMGSLHCILDSATTVHSKLKSHLNSIKLKRRDYYQELPNGKVCMLMQGTEHQRKTPIEHHADENADILNWLACIASSTLDLRTGNPVDLHDGGKAQISIDTERLREKYIQRREWTNEETQT
jgi:hypothetical protein